jgi:hypothetical protein
MSKQVLVVSGQQRSIRGRVITLVVLAGLIVFAVQSPSEAAAAVRTVWGIFIGAVDAVATFVGSL